MLYCMRSPSTDPYFNLALEQVVFDRLDRAHSYLMLWQNDNTIVVGKYQNTYGEIDRKYVDEHQIRVVRRLSGGGAVYHDLGNLNYTFITDAGDVAEIRFDAFCRPIVELLQKLGVPARLEGRNDMTVEGRKFSGNAQYVKSGRVMHHGTLLFSSDLSVLGNALRVSRDKIESKGIASVRSRVCNLQEYLPADYSLADFERDLMEQITGGRAAAPYRFSPEELEAAETLRREVYEKWEWNYGRSPECSIQKTRRIEGVGKIEVFLDVKAGHMACVHFKGDYFSAKGTEALSRRLQGSPFTREGLRAALGEEDVGNFFQGLAFEDFAALMLQ